jgi:hypothetical protein
MGHHDKGAGRWLLCGLRRAPFWARLASIMCLVVQRASVSCLALIIAIKELYRRAGHDRRDGMLVDQLRMPVTAQKNAEIVKPRDDALQLDAIDEKNGQRDLLLSDMIQKRVLQILSAFSGHKFYPFYPLAHLETPEKQTLRTGHLIKSRFQASSQ